MKTLAKKKSSKTPTTAAYIPFTAEPK